MPSTPEILFNTKPLKRGTDELLNPRIDKLIEQLEEVNNEFTYATAKLKREDYEHAEVGFSSIRKIQCELKLLKRTISNHTS